MGKSVSGGDGEEWVERMGKSVGGGDGKSGVGGGMGKSVWVEGMRRSKCESRCYQNGQRVCVWGGGDGEECVCGGGGGGGKIGKQDTTSSKKYNSSNKGELDPQSGKLKDIDVLVLCNVCFKTYIVSKDGRGDDRT